MQVIREKEIKKRYRNKRYTIRVLESDNQKCHYFCRHHFPHTDEIDYCIIQEKMEALGASRKFIGAVHQRTEFCLKVFGNGGSK